MQSNKGCKSSFCTCQPNSPQKFDSLPGFGVSFLIKADSQILTTTISFVRHGLVHNPKDVYYGRLPRFGLSEEGRRQVEATAEYLARTPLAAVFCSPLLRARQTAQIILARHPGLKLHTTMLLYEAHTPFDGQPRTMLTARQWDLYTGTGDGYEQPADIFQRTQRFVTLVRRRYPNQHTVAVTHGDIIEFMMLWATGLRILQTDLATILAHKQGNYPSPASISTFTYLTDQVDEVPKYEYVVPYVMSNT